MAHQLDVVGQLSLQVGLRILPVDCDQAAMREIGDHRSGFAHLDFLLRIAEMRYLLIGEDRAGVLKECMPTGVHRGAVPK